MKKNVLIKLVTLSFLAALLLPLFVLPAISMPRDSAYANNLTIEGETLYVEDFSSITYRGASTTAFGWGSGTVVGARNSSLELLDFYPTEFPAYGLDVQGRKAYVNCFNATDSGYTINAFDLNNPKDIKRLSYRDSVFFGYTIEVDGDFAYIGATDAEVHYYNIQNPSALDAGGVYLGNVAFDGAITDIDIDGNLMYYTVFNSTSGRSLAFSDIEDPTIITGFASSWASSKGLGLEVEGTIGYIAASDEGFYVLDLHDKFSPVEYGHVDTPGNATDVIVDGAFAYVADGEAGVHIINVLDPTNPTIVGTYDTDGYARRLVKQGNTLFVADGSSITVLDVANPTHPLSVAAIGPHVDLYDVDLYGGVIVAVARDGLYTYRYSPSWGIPDISTTVFPNPFDQYQAWDVRVVGRIAYVAGGLDGFYTLDVRDPANPVLLDRYIAPAGAVLRVDVDNNLAHITTDTTNYVLDVSDPTNIVQLDSLSGATDMIDVCVQGNIMFVTMGTNIGIANFTNPTAVSVITDYLVPGVVNLTAVWAQGRKLYLADNFGNIGSNINLVILDITDLSTPTVLDTYSVTSYGEDLCVDGDLVYLADTDWMVSYNVSDPTSISYIGSSYPDNHFYDSYGVTNFGPYVLSAGGSEGVTMANETDFSDETATYYPNATAAMKITTNGDFAYVANKSNLIILRHFLSAGATFLPGTSIAESTEIDTIDGNKITSALLTVDAYIPPRTHIDYYMSADGGLNWEAMTPGVKRIFVNPGDALLWRAEIIGPEDSSAQLFGLTISYEYSALSPMMLYIIIGAGGGLLLIILIVIVVIAVRKKKTQTR